MLTTLATTALPAEVAAHSIYEHWGHWGGGPGFGWLFLLIPLFWIGIFVLIFTLVGRRWRRARWGGPGYDGPPWAHQSAQSSAEKVLANRFAEGDIDEVEYRARIEVLRANGQDPSAGR